MHHRPFDDGQGAPPLSAATTTTMRKRLPVFRNDADEAKFWDTHDSADFESELLEDEETIFVRPEVGLIELSPTTWRKLLAAARRRRTTPQRLVQRWLRERLTG